MAKLFFVLLTISGPLVLTPNGMADVPRPVSWGVAALGLDGGSSGQIFVPEPHRPSAVPPHFGTVSPFVATSRALLRFS